MRQDLVAELGRMATLLRGIRPCAISVKAALDYVDDINQEVGRQLTQVLGDLTTGIPVYSEEHELDEMSDTYWLVDPLDGISNFAHGIESVGISAALVQNGITEIAAVCDLYSGRVYSAERSKGAYDNSSRIILGETPANLIAVSTGALDKIISGNSKLYNELRAIGQIRNFGSQALQICGVARGAFALALSQEARLWDDLAGKLIAVEAGAMAYSAPLARNPGAPQRSLFLHPALNHKAPAICQAFWEEPVHGMVA